jgi:hypothetical protein
MPCAGRSAGCAFQREGDSESFLDSPGAHRRSLAAYILNQVWLAASRDGAGRHRLPAGRGCGCEIGRGVAAGSEAVEDDAEVASPGIRFGGAVDAYSAGAIAIAAIQLRRRDLTARKPGFLGEFHHDEAVADVELVQGQQRCVALMPGTIGEVAGQPGDAVGDNALVE